MKKGKISIIIAAALVLSLTGYFGLNYIINRIEKRNGTASAMANETKDKSGSYTYIPPTYEYDNNNKSNEENRMPATDNSIPATPWTPATTMDLDPKSITVYVNKEYTLKPDYVPSDLVMPDVPFEIKGNDERKLLRSEAAGALEKLFSAATEDGYTLYGVSGYRSYDRQKEIFLDNIVRKGKTHTLKYSAVPGTSEHQSGLAIDISCTSINYKLTDEFADSPEGKWVAENAHYFGYVIRYPKDRAKITGYEYEPWHIRYVGKELADYLYINKMTLDEYYKYTPSKNFDFEEKYADLINFVPTVTPTPTPAPTPSPTPAPTPAPSPTPLPEDKGDDKKDTNKPSITPALEDPKPDNGGDTKDTGDTDPTIPPDNMDTNTDNNTEVNKDKSQDSANPEDVSSASIKDSSTLTEVNE